MFRLSFCRKNLFPIALISLSFAGLFLIYGWIFVSYRFTTEIYLGQNGSGAVFEDPKISLSRLRDTLDLPPPPDLVENADLSLKETVLTSLTNGDRSIRIRSVTNLASVKTIEAIQKYVSDNLVASITPLYEAERRRVDIKIAQNSDLLDATRQEMKSNVESIAESNRIEIELESLAKGLRGSFVGSPGFASAPEVTTPNDRSASSAESTILAALSYYARASLLSTYESMNAIQLRAVRMAAEQSNNLQGKTIANLEAEMQQLKLDSSRLKMPSVSISMLRDVRPIGAGAIVRFLLGLMVGLFVSVLWVQLKDRKRAL